MESFLGDIFLQMDGINGFFEIINEILTNFRESIAGIFSSMKGGN